MNIKEGISNKMPTNFDHNPKIATRGQQVRLKSFGHPDGPRSTWSGIEPESWQRVGKVKGIELDQNLTEMNGKDIQKYRILVDFGDGSIASILPCILKTV
tara:strand:+ start:2138 stop:2437 length:300 start_codon:yes stop_codon:yes gene_type:complete